MRAAFLMTIVFSLALLGCNQAATESPASGESAVAAKDLTPEELGRLGAAIEKNPENAEQILSDRGLNEQTFETEIRKISEDAEASKRYAEAYQAAKATNA